MAQIIRRRQKTGQRKFFYSSLLRSIFCACVSGLRRPSSLSRSQPGRRDGTAAANRPGRRRKAGGWISGFGQNRGQPGGIARVFSRFPLCLIFPSELLDVISMGCVSTKQANRSAHSVGSREAVALAAETYFTVNEVEALYDLFQKLSNSIVKDGLIHKEEFHLAVFRNKKKNLFVDRVFDLFDQKRNGVIEFGEFVRSLSVFHPDAPEEEKIAFAFRLYDLRQTGCIERHELKEMVLALLDESDLNITPDAVESIVNRTFDQADTKGDGKIDQEEWNEFAKQNPYVLRNMSLPYLKDVTMVFPSFVMHSEVNEADMAA